MSDPEVEITQAPSHKAIWSAQEAYPLIANETHSMEYISIPSAVQRIGESLYGEHWLSSEEMAYFPLGCINGRYFKLVKNPKYGGRKNKPPMKLYLDEVSPSVLEGAYARFKEIRDKIKLAIDGGSFRIALGNSRAGIVSIDNKHYLIRKINMLVATGRIRAPNYDDGDPHEMVLINANDFDAWLKGPEGGRKKIPSARLDAILQRIEDSPSELIGFVRKGDLFDVFDDVKSKGFDVSDNQINERIWKKIDKSLKRPGAPGKHAEQFSVGKARIKEIVDSVLDL